MSVPSSITHLKDTQLVLEWAKLEKDCTKLEKSINALQSSIKLVQHITKNSFESNPKIPMMVQFSPVAFTFCTIDKLYTQIGNSDQSISDSANDPIYLLGHKNPIEAQKALEDKLLIQKVKSTKAATLLKSKFPHSPIGSITTAIDPKTNKTVENISEYEITSDVGTAEAVSEQLAPSILPKLSKPFSPSKDQVERVNSALEKLIAMEEEENRVKNQSKSMLGDDDPRYKTQSNLDESLESQLGQLDLQPRIHVNIPTIKDQGIQVSNDIDNAQEDPIFGQIIEHDSSSEDDSDDN